MNIYLLPSVWKYFHWLRMHDCSSLKTITIKFDVSKECSVHFPVFIMALKLQPQCYRHFIHLEIENTSFLILMYYFMPTNNEILSTFVFYRHYLSALNLKSKPQIHTVIDKCFFSFLLEVTFDKFTPFWCFWVN